MSGLENYVSDDGKYIIPVEWTVYSNIIVSGVNNLQEAKNVVEQHIEDIPCDPEPEYVDGSYRISHSDEELKEAQKYTKWGVLYSNPDSEEL